MLTLGTGLVSLGSNTGAGIFAYAAFGETLGHATTIPNAIRQRRSNSPRLRRPSNAKTLRNIAPFYGIDVSTERGISTADHRLVKWPRGYWQGEPESATPASSLLK